MTQNVNVHLAQYKSLKQWSPQTGDLLIWHGLITHWYGIINGINSDGTLSVIKAGMPLLLVTMKEHEYAANTITVPISKIVASRGGYAALQNNIWYI